MARLQPFRFSKVKQIDDDIVTWIQKMNLQHSFASDSLIRIKANQFPSVYWNNFPNELQFNLKLSNRWVWKFNKRRTFKNTRCVAKARMPIMKRALNSCVSCFIVFWSRCVELRLIRVLLQSITNVHDWSLIYSQS